MDLFGVLMLSLTGALIGMFSTVPFTSISSDYNFVERLRSTFRIGYVLGTVGEAVDIIQPPNHPPNTWHKTLTYTSGNLPEETDFISVDFEAIELQTETTTVIPTPTPNPTETVTVTVVVTTTEVVYLPPKIEIEDYTSSLTINPTATSFLTRPSQDEETLLQPERTKIVRIIIPQEYFFGGDNPPPISLSRLILEVAKELASRVSHKFTRRTPPESSWYSPRIEKRHDAFIDGWVVMVLLGIPLTLLFVALSAGRVRLRAALEAGHRIKRRLVPMNNDREVAVHRVRTLNNILDDFTNGSNNMESGTRRVQDGEEEEDVAVAAPRQPFPPSFSPSTSPDPPLSFHANEVIFRNMFKPFLDERLQLLEENMRSLSKVCAQLTRDVKNDFAEQKAQIRGLVERIELLDMNASEITFTKAQIEDQFTKFADAKECIAQFLEKADGCLTYYRNYKEKMNDIKKTAKRNSTDIKAIGMATSNNSTNIKAIEIATNDNSTNIKDLEARIGYIKTHTEINMKEIKSDIKELRNTIHDIKADINGSQAGMDHTRNIQKDLNDTQEVIGADPDNTKQFNRHAVKVDHTERLIQNNTKDIADLRTSTIDTNSGQNDANNIHSSIKENAELRTSIKDTETRIENNTTEIQDLRQSVNGVETATGRQTNTVGKLWDGVSDIMWENLYDAESP
jgi:hypothetical protein